LEATKELIGAYGESGHVHLKNGWMTHWVQRAVPEYKWDIIMELVDKFEDVSI
jgi:hypothetical protein